MDTFSINKNHTCLKYVLYITLLKLTILSLFPLGVMHHEPCFHAGSSTSVFLLGRIRKVSSLFLFSVFFFFSIFFIFIFYSYILAPRVGLDIAMGWGFKVGNLLRGKTCQSVLVIRGR